MMMEGRRQSFPAEQGSAAGVGGPLVSPVAEAQRVREVLEQQRLMGNKRVVRWPLYTKQELEDQDPTMRSGMSIAGVARWRRQICHVLQKAGMSVRIPQWGIAVAMLLAHRFFSKKSMKRNDRFVVAAACLHLASKMEESPKPIRDLVKECLRVRLTHLSPERLSRELEPDKMDAHKDEVLVAERAVMYTLGFDLNAAHPYTFLVEQLSKLGLLQANVTEGSPYRTLMQNAWNLINDSYRSTLCLQLRPETIAFSVLYIAASLNKAMCPQHPFEELLRTKTGNPNANFFSYFCITDKDVQVTLAELVSVYKLSKVEPGEGLGAEAMQFDTSTAPVLPAGDASVAIPPAHAAFAAHVQQQQPQQPQQQQQPQGSQSASQSTPPAFGLHHTPGAAHSKDAPLGSPVTPGALLGPPSV